MILKYIKMIKLQTNNITLPNMNCERIETCIYSNKDQIRILSQKQNNHIPKGYNVT